MPRYPAFHRPSKDPDKRVRELPIRVRLPGVTRFTAINAAIDAERKASLVSEVFAAKLGYFRSSLHGTGIERVKLEFQLVNYVAGQGQRSLEFDLAFDIVDSADLQEYQAVNSSAFAGIFQIPIVLSSEFLNHRYIKKYDERLSSSSINNALVIELYPEFCKPFAFPQTSIPIVAP
jgi:hypothetical protein